MEDHNNNSPLCRSSVPMEASLLWRATPTAAHLQTFMKTPDAAYSQHYNKSTTIKSTSPLCPQHNMHPKPPPWVPTKPPNSPIAQRKTNEFQQYNCCANSKITLHCLILITTSISPPQSQLNTSPCIILHQYAEKFRVNELILHKESSSISTA